MKIYNYIAVCAVAWLGLTSCETRESILDDDSTLKNGYGALELSVTAKEPVTKAVSTNEFPVIITGEDGEVVSDEYTGGTLPDKIVLPVGDYTVSAHSSGTLEKSMEGPYYAGSADLAITNKVTQQTTVTCTQQNSRIRLEYDDKFLTTFSEWLVTVDDGSESVLAYTHQNGISPRDVYYLFGDKVEELLVNVSAKTMAGETVKGSYKFTKENASASYENESKYFEGGDALVIKLTALEPDAPTTGQVAGIYVTVNITFANSDTSVIIPVEDLGTEEDDPNQGGEDDGDGEEDNAYIQITEPNGNTYLTDGVTYPTADGSVPNVVINMTFEKGLQNMYVLASSTHEIFSELLGVMGGLTTAPGLDLTSSKAKEENLGELFPLPEVGNETYSFTLTKNLLDLMLEQGCPGIHTFQLTATDTEGNSVTKALTVTIVKTETSEEEE